MKNPVGRASVPVTLILFLKSFWWHRHLAGAVHRLESLCY